MSIVEALFNSDEILLFRHRSTGAVIETTNMFYLAFDNVWEYLGPKSGALEESKRGQE